MFLNSISNILRPQANNISENLTWQYTVSLKLIAFPLRGGKGRSGHQGFNNIHFLLSPVFSGEKPIRRKMLLRYL